MLIKLKALNRMLVGKLQPIKGKRAARKYISLRISKLKLHNLWFIINYVLNKSTTMAFEVCCLSNFSRDHQMLVLDQWSSRCAPVYMKIILLCTEKFVKNIL